MKTRLSQSVFLLVAFVTTKSKFCTNARGVFMSKFNEMLNKWYRENGFSSIEESDIDGIKVENNDDLFDEKMDALEEFYWSK